MLLVCSLLLVCGEKLAGHLFPVLVLREFILPGYEGRTLDWFFTFKFMSRRVCYFALSEFVCL